MYCMVTNIIKNHLKKIKVFKLKKDIYLFFLKILFIYSTEIETARERGNTSRGGGRGRSRLIAEEPDVGLDPRTPDHTLSQRQMLND